MKHEWKLITPTSCPVLVAKSSIEAPMRYSTGWSLSCRKCGEDICIPYDVLDTDRIADFIVKQKKRKDCKK